MRNSRTESNLKKIATAHRLVIGATGLAFASVVYRIYNLESGVIYFEDIAKDPFIIGIYVVFSSLVSNLVFNLYGLMGTVVLTAMSFIPFVNFFVFLRVTQEAKTILEDHGVEVGLFGADPSQFD